MKQITKEIKKFKLTDETIQFYCYTLHRIQALIDFSDVKAGDLGGWIENENNLSQSGNAWVYDDAKVFINAEVSGNAKVFDNAEVFGWAKIGGNAKVGGNAMVGGKTIIC